MRLRPRAAALTLAGVVAAAAAIGIGGAADVARLPSELELRSGDVVLRRGTGFWSGAFARLNRHDRRFSHAGIVILDDGRWRVVHAEADDLGRAGIVRVDDWDDFMAGVPQLALLRLDDAAIGAKVADAALTMQAASLPFDFEFDLDGADAVYCSELVWRALADGLGRDPLPMKPVLNGREAVLVESFLLDMPDLTLIHVTPPVRRSGALSWLRQRLRHSI